MKNLNTRLMTNMLTWLQVMILMLGYLRNAGAHVTFNPHALEIGNPGQPVADLSIFAEAGGQLPGIYRVTVFVNGEQQGEAQDIAFIAGPDGKLAAQISPAMLEEWGVNTAAFPALTALPPDQPLDDPGHYIPMASSELRFSKLQLKLSFPQAAMSTTARGWVDPSQWDDGVPAALLSYNLSGSNAWRNGSSGTDDNYYANLQSGLNFGGWRLRNYAIWNHNEDSGSHMDSINTYLQRDIRLLKGQLTLGEHYTPPDIFDSVQFSGVQLASSDNMLPDSLRGFAPIIRGIARSNARVTIRQNGYTIYQSYVAPGAFTISDLYPTSGSGDLTVTIREADGRKRTFIQPFSAVPIMQREGHLKYSLTGGKYRSGRDNSDTPEFGQVTAVYGLPHGITVYGGTQYSADYQSGAAGLGVGLGTLGSLSADLTAAHTTLNGDETRSGQSYRVQYAKDFQTTDTTFTLAAYRYSTAGFYTFQEASDLRGDNHNGWQRTYRKLQKLQLELSQSLGRYGSFFISGYQQDYWHQESYERTLSTGWNVNYNGVSYSTTFSYSEYPDSTQPADQQLAFTVQVPLSRFLPGAWASYSTSTAKQGSTRHQAGLNGTALADNNLNYSLQQSYTNHSEGSAGSINADYKGGQGEIAVGYSYDDDNRRINASLKGGIVAHPYGVTFSQPHGNALAIVKAPGANEAKVKNNTGVYTDWRGYAVVPYVNAYRKNRIELDTRTLGDDVEIDTAVQTVTPTQGAVVMVNFNTRVGQRVLMTLLYRGRPVPYGAQVKVKDGASGIVGNDGQVYLTGMPEKGEITVNWNGTQKCMVQYRLPEKAANARVAEAEQECRA